MYIYIYIYIYIHIYIYISIIIFICLYAVVVQTTTAMKQTCGKFLRSGGRARVQLCRLHTLTHVCLTATYTAHGSLLLKHRPGFCLSDLIYEDFKRTKHMCFADCHRHGENTARSKRV